MDFAINKICHPATMALLRNQFSAKLAGIVNAFGNPRRKVLAVVAVVMGFIWLSQAIASIMLRESADPERLKLWIPLGLFVYSIWHVIKISLRKPVEPFEWTPAEQELVCAAPITRTQLIGYRMASIVSSAAVKAICFSVVMIPDLSVWVFGLLGMFLGLLMVDLIRVAFELFFHGLSKRGMAVGRCIVVGGIVGVLGWALATSLLGSDSSNEIASPGALIFFQGLIGKLIGLTETTVGVLFLLPFKPAAEFILSDGISSSMLLASGLSILLVGSLSMGVFLLDRWATKRRLVFEKKAFARSLNRRASVSQKKRAARRLVSVPWKMGGFGTLAWRQLLGAYHYRMTVLVSLGIPTGLCCIPLLADHNPLMMLMNIVAGLVFYSFLLLPSALILDFRRDVDRFSVLKSLPIHPFVVTIGQLAAPVLICSAFQWVVLTIAVCIGPVIAWQAIIAAVLLLPINTLIFSIENFAFMLSPYRRNREGIDVFLRTILTFTGKGILFALGLACTLGWAFASRGLCQWLEFPSAAGAVFGIGAWTMACLVAAAFVFGIVRLYDRMDASEVVV
jgi:hypothetical protein